jgi:hypothetical protein
MMARYNDLTPERLACLEVVATSGGRMNHENPALLPFLDEKSTLRDPDIFNQCHDAGWLRSGYDDRTDDSYVYLTDAGRAALAPTEGNRHG